MSNAVLILIAFTLHSHVLLYLLSLDNSHMNLMALSSANASQESCLGTVVN